jgi:hypothetical protein
MRSRERGELRKSKARAEQSAAGLVQRLQLRAFGSARGDTFYWAVFAAFPVVGEACLREDFGW